MKVHLNGEARDLTEGVTVADVVALVAPSPRGVAVARNGDIVPRSAWDTTPVGESDRIEILGAAQGG